MTHPAGVPYPEQPARIPIDPVALDGDLVVPLNAQGVIAFAHGSGSSRHSPRNRFVARQLQDAHLATLLFDLLTPAEEHEDMYTGHLRFDIELLAERLVAAIDWLAQQPPTRHLPIGLFGASTGAAAAIVAAALRPEAVAAVVSRGGRPDLAGGFLPHLKAPTLLLVGGNDIPVINMNRSAMAQMKCARELQLIPGATHLFEEPGALQQVARAAREWFAHHLASAPPAPH